MKLLTLALFVTLFSTTAFSSSTPICKGPEHSIPCQYSEADAQLELISMMLHNKAGMDELYSIGQGKLILNFTDDRIKVTTLSDEPAGEDMFITKTRYEIQLFKCRGTDVCGNSYLWVVDETTTSDGMWSGTEYENKFIKLTDITEE